jgi:GGDEF domain-containing protein
MQRMSKAGLSPAQGARVWALVLGVMTGGATLLMVTINPFEVALGYLTLLGVVLAIGLMTNTWGGLIASGLSVFAIVLFNQYAGIYLRESRLLNIGTELGVLLLVGPVAGRLTDSLERLRRAAEHWQTHAEELTIHDETFGTLKPEWSQRRLEEELLRATRFARPLSVALLQLEPLPEAPSANRAERVAALQALIRVARAAAPPPAVVAHLGGDQVLVILPEHTPDEAAQMIQSLQAQAGPTMYFPSGKTGLGQPLSAWGAVRAGVAGLNGSTDSREVLLAQATAALEEKNRHV